MVLPSDIVHPPDVCVNPLAMIFMLIMFAGELPEFIRSMTMVPVFATVFPDMAMLKQVMLPYILQLLDSMLDEVVEK